MSSALNSKPLPADSSSKPIAIGLLTEQTGSMIWFAPGTYDDSRFFRVVAGRWVQFAINEDPRIAQQRRHYTIPDDALKQHNTPGYVAFSSTGPNTRSTQVYINLGDNSARNDREAGFASFDEVIEGMEVVEKLHTGYGENYGGGMRAGQDKMFCRETPISIVNFPNSTDRFVPLSFPITTLPATR